MVGAVMYLGARVIRTNGIATHITHISGIIVRSFPSNFNLSTNISAINATINLPTIAEGTKLIFFADLMITAPTASPVAQTKPKKFPKKSPTSNYYSAYVRYVRCNTFCPDYPGSEVYYRARG